LCYNSVARQVSNVKFSTTLIKGEKMEKELKIIAQCFERKLQGQGWGESMLGDCLILEKAQKTKYVAFEDLTYALQYGLKIEENSARKLRASLIDSILKGELVVPGFKLKEENQIVFVAQN